MNVFELSQVTKCSGHIKRNRRQTPTGNFVRIFSGLLINQVTASKQVSFQITVLKRKAKWGSIL